MLHFNAVGPQHGCREILDVERDDGVCMADDGRCDDMAIFPWVRCLVDFYGAGDLVGMADYPNVSRVLAAFVARPAVARGLVVPAQG